MELTKSISVLVGLLLVITISVVNATDSGLKSLFIKDENMTTSNLNSIVLMKPKGYELVRKLDVVVDSNKATLYRYQPENQSSLNLGGEHFSYIEDQFGILKGFVNYNDHIPNESNLPTQELSEKIAKDFLQKYAPDLLPEMEVHWIKPHSEMINIEHDGMIEQKKITGMKVKCRNKADGLWFWVIVNDKNLPFVFERDIEWITFPGKRQTEKWLHDDWL